MKKNHILFALFFFFSLAAFSQKVIKHKISKGETILALAIKYDVSEKDIYELNPKAKGALLQLNQVLRIPNKKFKEKEKPSKVDKKEKLVDKNIKKEKLNSELPIKEVTEPKIIIKEEFLTHLVLSKETLYSISKKYGITMETICELNPILKTENLKKGIKLKIPNQEATQEVAPISEANTVKDTKTEVVADVNTSGDLVHKVVPKETLYRIAKTYGVTVSDLEKLNPGIENGLPVDYLLIVKKGVGAANSKVIETIPLPVDDVEIKDIPAGNIEKAEFLIKKASENLGTRYRSGGSTSAGFDCSGLMFSTFQNLDMTLPRSSHEMAGYGVKINKVQAQKGDLIFFATFGGRRISHVGLVTEVTNGEIKFIHSSTGSGVVVSSLNEPYYARTFVQVNRVLPE
ncbi:NlpC/P60 family protein [Flavobacterium sp.]|uniref:NlpC/P60 family protein n=1 Tax=Flavobacterium sp. TaxID=239 RepID=UPI00333E9976